MDESGRDYLEALGSAVERHDTERVGKLAAGALEAGWSTWDVRRAILAGLDSVRHRLMSNKASIPEFLLCIDTTMQGLQKIAAQSGEGALDGPTLVIGVVEGDPHDLGKDIIAGVYRASGYRVIDLGCQVSAEEFLRAVLDNDASVLALSAMMSTTMTGMRDVVMEVKKRSPRTVVMVGGAPLDRTLAIEYGADGYAESAVTVLEETEAVLPRASGDRA